MPLVTLIGEKLADKGEEFIYLGPNNDCRNCKLKTVCFNLKAGRRYKISNIRDKKHACNIHEGAASVIEVEELPIITLIDLKHSEGDEIKFKERGCNGIGCINYELCNACLQKEKNYIVVKIIENIECPLKHKLQKVELREK